MKKLTQIFVISAAVSLAAMLYAAVLVDNKVIDLIWFQLFAVTGLITSVAGAFVGTCYDLSK